jgi:formate dehydrogenase subunit gamma
MSWLLVRGIVILRAYFTFDFPIPMIHLPALVQAICGWGIFCARTVHSYAVF